MTMAATLTEAAHLSYKQADILWAANTLKPEFATFITTAQPIFDDNRPNDRPVGNWLILMQSLSSQMAAGTLPEAQLNTCVEYLFRMCLAGASQLANGLISNAQAVSLLAAWNATIGT